MWRPPRLALAFGVAVGFIGPGLRVSDGRGVTHLFLSEAIGHFTWLAIVGALVLTLAAPDGAHGSAGTRVRARLVTLARSHAWIILLMLPSVLVLTFALGTGLATAWALAVAGPVLFAHAGMHATDAALAAVWSASTRVRRTFLALLHVALFLTAAMTQAILPWANPYAIVSRAEEAVTHGGAFPAFAIAFGLLASVACFALPRREHATEGVA